MRELNDAVRGEYGDSVHSASLSRLVRWMVRRESLEASADTLFGGDGGRCEELDELEKYNKVLISRAEDTVRRIVDDTFGPRDDEERKRHMGFAETLLARIREFLYADFDVDVAVSDIEYLARLANGKSDGWLGAVAWIASDARRLPDSVRLELWGEDAFSRSLSEFSKALRG